LLVQGAEPEAGLHALSPIQRHNPGIFIG